MTSDERAEMKELEAAEGERDPVEGIQSFRSDGARPPTEELTSFNDTFSRMIVRWRRPKSLHTDRALDAVEQALYACPKTGKFVHPSDRGVQHMSLRCTECFREAGIEPSVGSVGDSYDNALAVTIIGLYKTGGVQLGLLRDVKHVEFETLNSVGWFNTKRLLDPVVSVPPTEFEEVHYHSKEAPALAAGLR